MASLVGRDLGRYHVVEQLGEGGMASVYKAFDTRLERYVAIKVILTSQQESDQFLKRFDREAKALARLTHSNIVGIIDYGEDQGIPYLVMEYLPGGNLKHMMTGQPVPYQEAASLLAPIARALNYAHQHQIIHRDVKPANILITESGTPMLSDFGIAKILSDTSKTDLTGTGVGIGTPDYMSPEQGKGEKVDARSDVYSLGIIFYELVVGRRPFTADTPMATIFKQALEPLPRPKSFVPSLPDEVEAVLFKALAKSPDDRYQDMGSFATALEMLLRTGPTIQVQAKAEPSSQTVTQVSPVVPTRLSPQPAAPMEEMETRVKPQPSAPSIGEVSTRISPQPAVAPPSGEEETRISPKPSATAAAPSSEEVATRVSAHPLAATSTGQVTTSSTGQVAAPITGAETVVSQRPAAGIPAVGAPATELASKPAAKPRRGISSWVWIGIGAVVILAVLIAGGLFFLPKFLANQLQSPTSIAQVPTDTPEMATETQAPPPTNTPQPAVTKEPTLEPTKEPTLEPTKEPTKPGGQGGDCGSKEVFCIGLITDQSGINDRGFNQSAWDALNAARDKLGAVVNYIETKNQDDAVNGVAAFAMQKYDVVVTVGFNFQGITRDLAQKFPDTMFIGVDQTQPDTINNVIGLIFPEDQAGFVVGALAAMMSKSQSICAVLGPDSIPPVWRYGEGYRQGAMYINPKIIIGALYYIGPVDKAFNDAGWGHQTAIDLMAKTGCDVIFAAAGSTGIGALQAAAENKIYAIGVDTDQYLTVEAPIKPWMLSSATKDITISLYNLIEKIKTEGFPGGNYVGRAGFAPFHDLEPQVPADVKDKLIQIMEGLTNGSIKTNVPAEKPK